MPARTLRPGNRKRKRDAGIVNFSSGQTSNRHWLGGGHRSPSAPRILASVRPGRARDSFSTLGEPTKGFRPHRSPSLVRLRAAQGLDARHHAASVATMFPGRRVLRDSSMSGARWRRRASSDACRCSHPTRSPSARRRPVWPARRKPSGCGTELLHVVDFSNSTADAGRA
jgi:hypothetical protein